MSLTGSTILTGPGRATGQDPVPTWRLLFTEFRNSVRLSAIKFLRSGRYLYVSLVSQKLFLGVDSVAIL